MKPLLISLFETFVVNLEVAALKPALKAIILTLLPGLEESASEEFERTHNLLDKFRKLLIEGPISDQSQSHASDDRFFWQSFFMASISNASRRQGALAYLERNLPQLGAGTENASRDTNNHTVDEPDPPSRVLPSFEAVTSPEPGLLIRAFAAGLQDDLILNQRGYLELLVTHVPLSSMILHKRVSKHDLELLVLAATSVVIRREMSLNRRLWLWFLGQTASQDQDPEQSGASSPQHGDSNLAQRGRLTSPMEYFEQYGLNALVESLLTKFRSDSRCTVTRARPFRICLSLMDRWEIGGLVLPRVFKPAMDSVHRYEALAPSKDSFAELLRSANVFFDAIQSTLIWKEVLSLISGTPGQPEVDPVSIEIDDQHARLELVWFIVTNFNIREEDMLLVHIPHALLLLLHVAEGLAKRYDPQATVVSRNIDIVCKISHHLLDQLPERAFAVKESQQGIQTGLVEPSEISQQDKSALRKILKYYDHVGQAHLDSNLPYSETELADLLLLQSQALTIVCLEKSAYLPQLGSAISIAMKLFGKVSELEAFDSNALLRNLFQKHNELDTFTAPNFFSIHGQISILELLHMAVDPKAWQRDAKVRHVISRLVRDVWGYISPLRSCHNVEAIRCLWRLNHVCPDENMMEAAVTSLFYHNENGLGSQEITIEALQRFTALWTHTVTTSRSSLSRRPSLFRPQTPSSKKSEDSSNEASSLARPLFLVLDTLKMPQSELCIITRNWLQSISTINLFVCTKEVNKSANHGI